MTSESYAEFVGLTAEAIALIEQARRSPNESKSAILVRVLKSRPPFVPSDHTDSVWFDFGEGIRVREGEKLYLFLNRMNRYSKVPDAQAEIRGDSFYLNGERFGPSNKRQFTPAMQVIQREKGHVDANGEPISTSSMRQWCVVRNGELVSLVDIKDPKLARKRGKPFDTANITIEGFF